MSFASFCPGTASASYPLGRESRLHPEHAKFGVFYFRIHRRGQREPQHVAGLRRVDYAVVPQPGTGVVGVTLMLVLLAGGLLEGLFLCGAPFAAFPLVLLALDLGENAGGLLATHDRNARVGPHE